MFKIWWVNPKGLPIFFAAHPKRQTALEKAISVTQPMSKVHKLKDMCRTRWVHLIEAIQAFKSLHQSTVACMEGICNDGPGLWTPDTLTDARGLQLAMITTHFICAVVITNACLKYIQALTSHLQAEAKYIVAAVKEIDSHSNSTKCQRQHIRSSFPVVCYGWEDVRRCRHRAFFPLDMWSPNPS